MGVEVRICVSGQKDVYVDLLEQMMVGKLSREQLKDNLHKAERVTGLYHLGSSGYIANFGRFLRQIMGDRRDRYLDYVLYVIDHSNELILHHNDVLIFSKGLEMLESLIPKDSDKHFLKTFKHLRNVVHKYIHLKKPHSTIEFS